MMDVLFFVCLMTAFSTCHSSGEECPPLPMVDLDNGRIIRVTRTRVRFVCNDGYFIAGPKAIHCKKGEWSSQLVPRCMMAENRCDPPPDVTNADRWGDDTTVGSSVMYICRPGYFMYGTSIRNCLRTLSWSGLTPSCHDEKESLSKVAIRLDNQFVSNVGSFSNEANVVRLLDDKSLKVGLELVILLDSSSSIDPVDFSQGVNFIKFLVSEFGVKNGNNAAGTRLAVITFGDKETIQFNLDTSSVDSPEEAMNRLDDIKPSGGGTAMQPALSSVVTSVTPLTRKEAKKAIFLITDGVPNIGEFGIEPEDTAKLLKGNFGFEIFTVGVGPDTDRVRLSKIASEPSINHVFMMDKYADFNEIMWLIKNKATPAPLPGPDKCGFLPPQDKSKKKKKRRAGDAAPWLSAIYVKIPEASDGKGQMSFCTGALICRYWVLTAASCFYTKNESGVWTESKDEVYVTLGEHRIYKTDASQINFYATEVVIHPDFDPETNQHNLALIHLNAPVPLNFTYRPICLPSKARVMPLWAETKINPTLVGWGTKESGWGPGINAATVDLLPRAIELPIAGEADCQDKIGRNNVGKGMFCVGYGSSVNGSCSGDEGGPITAMDPSTSIHHVLGVMTNRQWCANKYSVYTLVRDYVEWIDWATNDCQDIHLP